MDDLVKIEIDEAISLRQIAQDDASFIFSLIENNRDYLRKYLNWVDDNRSLEDVISFVDSCNATVFAQKGMTFVILKYDEIIGCIDFHSWNQLHKKVAVGYWIAENYSKKGIVTKCVSVLLNYLFITLKIEKVELHFMEENKASARVAEKLGFKIEGILRNRYYLQGSLKNLVITGLLIDEWRSLNR